MVLILGCHFIQLHTKGLDLDHHVDLKSVAAACNGYVGADLEALCKEAAKSTYSRSLGLTKEGRIPHLKIEDWEHARLEVGPSITRGIAKEIPNVSWDDVGGLKDLKVQYAQWSNHFVLVTVVFINILVAISFTELHHG